MAYCGEIFGNWVALSLVSAAVVTPLGIVAVLVTALLSQKYLDEVITSRQKLGYLLIIIGVFLILYVAPKSESSLGTSVAEVLEAVSRPIFVFGLTIVLVALVYFIWQLLIMGQDHLEIYVTIQALFGSVTVICSKLLTSVIRFSATRQTIQDKSRIDAENRLKKLSDIPSQHESGSHTSELGATLSILLVGVVGCAVGSELVKQQVCLI